MGSLTKTGKVRDQTPKVEKTAIHNPTSPRNSRRRQYKIAVGNGLLKGTYSPRGNRRRRRR